MFHPEWDKLSSKRLHLRNDLYSMRPKIPRPDRSAQERISQHFESWKKKDSKFPLFRHSELYHEGREFPVSVKVLRNCFGDPTTRRITESILIDELSAGETMYAKGEWTYIKLNKITMQT